MAFKTGAAASGGGAGGLTANRAVITDNLGDLTTSVTTSTEISYVSGVTSSIQTQLNGKQAVGNYITALTGDVAATGPGSVAATIQAGAVTLAKMANLAASSIIGNNTGSPATPLALTGAQVTAMLGTFTTTLQGVVPGSGGGTSNFLRADGAWAVPPGTAGGTVTSVGLADSTGLFNVTGSPVTGSGTLTLASFQSQAANTFLAAPNGGAGAPTFRAIVAADVPTLNQNTTGTASNVTGTVAIANGGTGQTTASAAFNALSPMTTGGDLLYGGASGAGTRLANGSSGQVLQSNGGTAAPSWVTPAVSTASSNFQFTDLVNPSSGVTTNFSNGTQTVTFSGSGKFRITLDSKVVHSNTYTSCRFNWTLGGTATRSDIMGNGINIDGIAASSSDQYDSTVIYGSFTNGQTVTILPKGTVSYVSTSHTFSAGYLVEIIN